MSAGFLPRLCSSFSAKYSLLPTLPSACRPVCSASLSHSLCVSFPTIAPHNLPLNATHKYFLRGGEREDVRRGQSERSTRRRSNRRQEGPALHCALPAPCFAAPDVESQLSLFICHRPLPPSPPPPPLTPHSLFLLSSQPLCATPAAVIRAEIQFQSQVRGPLKSAKSRFVSCVSRSS